MTEITVGLFNFEHGGLVSPGVYDLKKLVDVWTKPYDLFFMCEGKRWKAENEAPLHKLCSMLSTRFNAPYDGRLAHLDRGDIGPAVLFNSNRLALTYWGDSEVEEKFRNLLKFQICGTSKSFNAVPGHWHYKSGELRMPEANKVAWLGKQSEPTILAKDFNEQPSGFHLPRTNWDTAPELVKEHKGKKLPDGTYIHHSDAIDQLIGTWDERFSWGEPKAGRMKGGGFHLTAELAAKSGTPLKEAFTITTADGFLIDMVLLNDAWLKRGGVKAKTYRVIGADKPHWPSDHYLVEMTLTL